MNINDALNLLNIIPPADQKQIKKAYKAASLKFHPDKNPAGAQMMKAINAAYDFLKNLKEDIKTDEEFTANDYGEELNNILNQLLNLKGLIVEVCGNWVWISGNTKENKKEIKDLGCKWAKKKSMWYYRPIDYKSSGRGGWSIDEIRVKHGSSRPHKTDNKKIRA